MCRSGSDLVIEGVFMRHNFNEVEVGREFDVALEKVVNAMYALQIVLEKYQGDEDVICDGFPFQLSYEEQVAEVHGWWSLVNQKVAK